jgi:hypothetical protein
MPWIKTSIKTIKSLLKQHAFLTIFLFIICVIGCVALLKILKDNSRDLYVKVKVSQGLWWAYTQQPNLWYVQNIKQGMKQTNLSGKIEAEIVDMRYYPSADHNQYDVYLIIKAQANKNSRTGIYTIDRQNVVTASPIEFTFPETLVTGTVMDISTKPFTDKYIEKTLIIEKGFAPLWEFDSIPVGDKYFDGKEVVATVLDRSSSDTFGLVTSGGELYPMGITPQKKIRITLKVKVKKELNQLVLYESNVVQPGKILNIATDNFRFVDYRIVSIK